MPSHEVGLDLVRRSTSLVNQPGGLSLGVCETCLVVRLDSLSVGPGLLCGVKIGPDLLGSGIHRAFHSRKALLDHDHKQDQEGGTTPDDLVQFWEDRVGCLKALLQLILHVLVMKHIMVFPMMLLSLMNHFRHTTAHAFARGLGRASKSRDA